MPLRGWREQNPNVQWSEQTVSAGKPTPPLSKNLSLSQTVNSSQRLITIGCPFFLAGRPLSFMTPGVITGDTCSRLARSAAHLKHQSLTGHGTLAHCWLQVADTWIWHFCFFGYFFFFFFFKEGIGVRRLNQSQTAVRLRPDTSAK